MGGVGSGPKARAFKDCYDLIDTGYKTPCHIWKYSLYGDGYGQCNAKYNNGQQRAHIAAWQKKYKRLVPEGKQLHHKCAEDKNLKEAYYQRRCVNPSHLKVVTSKENHALMPKGNRYIVSLKQFR